MKTPLESLYVKTAKYPWLHHCLWTCYKGIKAFADEWVSYAPNNECRYRIGGGYSFVNRSKESSRLLIVLAGYKKDLWEDVFGRVHAYVDTDCDVCVITSGLINEQLKEMCSKNNWSYLSTKRNCLTLAQNIAIHLHEKAQWIYKLDEDMFITRDFISRLDAVYSAAEKRLRCDIGFVAPLINVNGFGCVKLLERLGKVKEWEDQFGPLRYTEGLYKNTAILTNPDAARFMWGIDVLDRIDETLPHDKDLFYVTPFRFSIGAIMFTRKLWQEMGMFPVSVFGVGLGADEEFLCQYCLMHTKAMVVASNIVVGHLAFGPQTKGMLDFYHTHKSNFIHSPA